MSLLSKIFGIKHNEKFVVTNQFDLDIMNFKTAKEFWDFITTDKNWFKTYSPFRINNIDKFICDLEPLIKNATNLLRKEMEFSYEEYSKINCWDNLLINADLDKNNSFKLDETIKFKQYCSSCKKEINFYPRYPKTVCSDCYFETTDLNNKKVEFYNSESLGFGCQGYYVGTSQEVKYDSDICYINGKKYFAEEGRFGGIVIQLKEEKTTPNI